MDYSLNGDDITNKRADELCDVVTNAGVGFWVWHVKEDRVEYNENFAGVLGYDKGSLGELDWGTKNSFVYDKDINRVKYHYQYVMSIDHKYNEIQYRLKDQHNNIVWVREYCVTTERDEDGQASIVAAMVGNITQLRKNMAIMEAESEYKNDMLNMLGVARWEFDAVHNKYSYSKEIKEILGFSQEELSGNEKLQENILHPDDLENYRKSLCEYIKNGTGTFSTIIKLLCRDGNYINALISATIVQRDDEGNAVKLSGSTIDIDNIGNNEILINSRLEKTERSNSELQKQIEENTEKTRIMNNAMFESNPQIALLINSERKLINCNPKAVSFFGYNQKQKFIDDFISNLDDIIPPKKLNGEDSVPFFTRLDLAEQDKIHEFDTTLIVSDELIPFHVVIQKIPYDNSFAFILSAIDLTETNRVQTELTKKERLLRGVNNVASELLEVEDSDFAYVIHKSLMYLGTCVDSERIAIWKNYLDDDGMQIAKRYSVWSKSDDTRKGLNDTGIDDWISVKYNEIIQKMGIELNKGKLPNIIFIDEEKYDIAEGSKTILNENEAFAVVPLVINGEFWGVISIIYEKNSLFHHLSESELAIIKSGAMLIASAIIKNEINEKLVYANEKAIESANSKGEFLSRMSHEIRTPMNAIIGMTALSQKTTDLDNIKNNLKIIESSSNQLLNIINDILDMSKIDANKLKIENEEFDFNDLIRHVTMVMSSSFDEKDQMFQVDLDHIYDRNMISDQLRISQVLINLLSNANKFAPAGGEIILKVMETPIAEYKSTMTFEVIDNGIGVSEEVINKIFDAFEQGDGGITREYGGTGLGLSISSKIAQLMDGTLTVANRSPRGAVFSFTIDVEWGGKSKIVSLNKEQKPLRVLVVDDQYDVISYFDKILHDLSHDCHVATSPEMAIRKAESQFIKGKPYDIIFLDWCMPGMNGGEVAKRIQQIMDNTANIIMVSGYDSSEIKEQTKGYGIKYYMSKPVLPFALSEVLLKILEEELPDEKEQTEKLDDYNFEGKRILVTEDNQINQMLVASILEDTKVKIDIAENGKECVEKFTRLPDRYDLIIMDIQMPIMDGIAATKMIRKSNIEWGKRIPIIAMTANAFSENEKEYLDAGMNDYVSKPIDVYVLLKKMKHHFETKN